MFGKIIRKRSTNTDLRKRAKKYMPEERKLLREALLTPSNYMVTGMPGCAVLKK